MFDRSDGHHNCVVVVGFTYPFDNDGEMPAPLIAVGCNVQLSSSLSLLANLLLLSSTIHRRNVLTYIDGSDSI